MADFEQAKKVFDGLSQMLDNRNWNYKKFEEDLVISSTVKGEDLPVEFIVHVDPETEVVRFLSKLPFAFGDDKRIDGALAICAANNSMVNGSFDYNITNGEVVFRLCNSFRDGSTISEAAFEYIVMVCHLHSIFVSYHLNILEECISFTSFNYSFPRVKSFTFYYYI